MWQSGGSPISTCKALKSEKANGTTVQLPTQGSPGCSEHQIFRRRPAQGFCFCKGAHTVDTLSCAHLAETLYRSRVSATPWWRPCTVPAVGRSPGCCRYSIRDSRKLCFPQDHGPGLCASQQQKHQTGRSIQALIISVAKFAIELFRLSCSRCLRTLPAMRNLNGRSTLSSRSLENRFLLFSKSARDKRSLKL